MCLVSAEVEVAVNASCEMGLKSAGFDITYYLPLPTLTHPPSRPHQPRRRRPQRHPRLSSRRSRRVYTRLIHSTPHSQLRTEGGPRLYKGLEWVVPNFSHCVSCLDDVYMSISGSVPLSFHVSFFVPFRNRVMGLYLAFSCAPLFDVFCLGLGWEESDLSGFFMGRSVRASEL
jgi:hypothetical protein